MGAARLADTSGSPLREAATRPPGTGGRKFITPIGAAGKKFYQFTTPLLPGLFDPPITTLAEILHEGNPLRIRY
jgi:hypothetical protein